MSGPFLDVSDVLLDPEIADSFSVIRRTQVTSVKGRITTADVTTDNVIGVVCMSHPNDLQRLDDNQRMGRHITIITQHRIQGPSPNKQPDYVVWNGDTYIVQTVDPYTRYGAGFVQIVAGSVDSVDQAP